MTVDTPPSPVIAFKKPVQLHSSQAESDTENKPFAKHSNPSSPDSTRIAMLKNYELRNTPDKNTGASPKLKTHIIAMLNEDHEGKIHLDMKTALNQSNVVISSASSVTAPKEQSLGVSEADSPGGGESQLLTDDSADEMDADLSFQDYAFTQVTEALCPICKLPVDGEELRSHGKMNMRKQAEFCDRHRRKSAEEAWASRGYPRVDWDDLNSRITGHHDFIRKLINGQDSHYRKTLSDSVKAGKDRNLMKMTTNIVPGYYGNRGLQVMSENIMQKFTALLRLRNVKDRTMAARGFAGFVQAVLVPEVAVLLIMEDMNVEVERAREILAESADIGELLHEELKDVAGQAGYADSDEEFA